ncbi:MAG: hypothetical protein AAF621_03110, partial [Pseudomonadota bacterium]
VLILLKFNSEHPIFELAHKDIEGAILDSVPKALEAPLTQDQLPMDAMLDVLREQSRQMLENKEAKKRSSDAMQDTLLFLDDIETCEKSLGKAISSLERFENVYCKDAGFLAAYQTENVQSLPDRIEEIKEKIEKLSNKNWNLFKLVNENSCNLEKIRADHKTSQDELKTIEEEIEAIRTAKDVHDHKIAEKKQDKKKAEEAIAMAKASEERQKQERDKNLETLKNERLGFIKLLREDLSKEENTDLLKEINEWVRKTSTLETFAYLDDLQVKINKAKEIDVAKSYDTKLNGMSEIWAEKMAEKTVEKYNEDKIAKKNAQREKEETKKAGGGDLDHEMDGLEQQLKATPNDIGLLKKLRAVLYQLIEKRKEAVASYERRISISRKIKEQKEQQKTDISEHTFQNHDKVLNLHVNNGKADVDIKLFEEDIRYFKEKLKGTRVFITRFEERIKDIDRHLKEMATAKSQPTQPFFTPTQVGTPSQESKLSEAQLKEVSDILKQAGETKIFSADAILKIRDLYRDMSIDNYIGLYKLAAEAEIPHSIITKVCYDSAQNEIKIDCEWKEPNSPEEIKSLPDNITPDNEGRFSIEALQELIPLAEEYEKNNKMDVLLDQLIKTSNYVLAKNIVNFAHIASLLRRHDIKTEDLNNKQTMISILENRSGIPLGNFFRNLLMRKIVSDFFKIRKAIATLQRAHKRKSNLTAHNSFAVLQ